MSEAIHLERQEFTSAALVDVADCAEFLHCNSPQDTVASKALLRHAPIRLSGVPGRLHETITPNEASSVTPNELPDIVLLTEANASALLTKRLGRGVAAILPVVDATCRGRGTRDHRRADIAVDRASQRSIEEAVEMLRPAVRRLRSLPREVIETDDPRLMLLTRLFVRDRAFAPRSEVSARETFVYDDEAAIPGAAALAEQLTELGLLERNFVDKTTVCPHCASARMTVRENCSKCGCANIVEEPIVHHMKCAYQGPERDFRRGSELICPKCLQQLRNFSVDYDRPGSIGICLSCGHLSTEHKVGFLCLDCGSRVDARNVDSKTIYSYGLTSTGLACVAGGSPLPQFASASISGRIRAFAGRHSALGEPCSVLFARLHRPQGVQESGDAWRQTCDFFGLIMRESFTPETEIIEAAPVFLALLGRDRKAEVERHLPQIRERLDRHLALAPKLELAVFSPDEIPGIAERPGKAA
jgi:hypothetical protein